MTTKKIGRLDTLSPREKRALLAQIYTDNVRKPRTAPMSFAQERIWTLTQLAPDNPAYNITTAYHLSGSLDVTVLEQGFNQIIRRHAVLRTTFANVDGEPVQIILPELTMRLAVQDLQKIPEATRERQVRQLILQEGQQPFELIRSPLFRATVLRLAEEEHVLILSTHLIVFDGQCWPVLISELNTFYQAFSDGKHPSLPELSLQYADFAVWQREKLAGEALDTQLAYWREKLGSKIRLLRLPTDYPRSAAQSPSETHTFSLPQDLSESLRLLSQQEGVSLFVMLLAAFQILLYRYTSQEDFLIFSSVAGRNHPDLQNLIGLFANILPLRADLSGNPSFRELLGRVRETVADAYAHQELPFERIREMLQVEHDQSYTSLFQVMFIFWPEPLPPVECLDITLRPLEIETKQAEFDLHLHITGTRPALSGSLEYKADLFQAVTIMKWLEQFEALLRDIVAAPEQRLSDLSVQAMVEYYQRLREEIGEPASGSERVFVAPSTPTEEVLARIWAEEFGHERVGIHDNFFELGGDSLKAVTITCRIRKQLHVELPLSSFFTHPTIQELAERISASEEESSFSIEPVEKRTYYPVSYAQQRMYLLEHITSEGTNYNMSFALLIQGELDQEAFQNVFRQLIQRHETLRTSFTFIKGELVQHIHDAVDFNIVYKKAKKTRIDQLLKELIQPFDLAAPPLLRVFVIQIEEEQPATHILLCDMHHIISDGFSLNILVNDLIAFYHGKTLLPLRIQYKDYAVWHNNFLESPLMKKQEQYWLKKLAGELPVLNMPFDFPRQTQQSFKGATLEFIIPAPLLSSLRNFSQKQEKPLTLNMLLISLYAILLHKYTGQHDIIIGSVVAGRQRPDLEHIIGMFPNFLPIRFTIDEKETVSKFLASTGEMLLEAYENQDYPFDKLVEKLWKTPIPGRNPLYDTLLIVHNQSDPRKALHIENLTFREYALESGQANLDIAIGVYHQDSHQKELPCVLEYKTELFKEETMQKFVRNFIAIIECVVKNPDIQVSEISLLTTEISLQKILLQEIKTSPVYEIDRKYWLSKLEDFPSAPALPLTYAPSEISKPRFRRQKKIFPKNVWQSLKEQAKRHNITPSGLLATAYALVLAYWSNQPHFAFNFTVFNRYPVHEEVDNIVGDSTSILLVEVNLPFNASFWECARVVQQTLFEALEHRHYDGVEFIHEIIKDKKLDKTPAMPIVFTSMLFDFGSQEGTLTFAEALGEVKMGISQTSQVYLNNQVNEQNGELWISWDYVERLFERSVIEAMFDQYCTFLIKLLDEEEYIFQPPKDMRVIIENYNATNEDILPTTLHQLLQAQVQRTPEKIAMSSTIVDQTPCQLTYQELDARSNQVAWYLRTQGIGRNDLIGVLTERGINSIVNVIGILKAGAAYVPIDTEYPKERRQYIYMNSNCKMLLEPELYSIKNLSQYPANEIEHINEPDDVAYVLYTSGSTGVPKGVVITHKAVTNTIIDINRKFGIMSQDRILGISSMCFDLSVYDVFGAFSTGACLIVIPDQKDIPHIIRVLEDEHITFWNSVPAIMALMVDQLETNYINDTLKNVLLSGDWIPVDLPKKIHRHFRHTQITSLGGATEGSIWSIYYPIQEVQETWNSIPYGFPLANQQIYVLNYEMQPCPVGVPGELYIGGVGVASGYINDDEKTNKAFITHPQFGKLYRTGDYGILHQKGYIEFLGRQDSQVKIRGFRVELGEIENVLVKHPAIEAAMVTSYQESDGTRALASYYIEKPSQLGVAESVSVLRTYLLQELPEYMIPSYFVRMESFPLTTSGKIDRKALPDPKTAMQRTTNYHPPTNAVEAQLVEIWQTVLGIERIGITDNFFELGGHSLNGTRLMAEIHRAFQQTLPLSIFFDKPTVKKLAAIIRKTEAAPSVLKIPPVEQRDFYPVSAAQRRLFALQQVKKDSITYNETESWILEGKLDITRLKQALNTLIARHESLRTYFDLIDGEPVQKIAEQCVCDIEICGLETPKNIERTIRDFIRPFDVFTPPLLRVKLIELHTYSGIENDRFVSDYPKNGPAISSKYMFILDIHHIIIDGISIEIFMRELWQCYTGYELPPLPIQYKDFTSWQETQRDSAAMHQHRTYWLERFAGEFPVLNLPTDLPRPAIQSFEGETIQFEIEPETREGLYSLALQRGTTVYMVLLTAFNVLLSKYTGQNDIIVGTVTAGRQYTDLHNIVGMFVNTLALRNFPHPEKIFSDVVQEVKEYFLQAFEHQEYQFDDLVEDLNLPRDPSRNPLFDIMFVFQNRELVTIDSDVVKCRPYHFRNKTSKFDITMECIETETALYFNVEYCVNLFKRATMKRLIGHFSRILRTVVQDPDRRVSEINMLNDDEEQQLLFEFNNTQANYPKEKTIHQLFEEQVAQTPDNIAVVFEKNRLTYHELNTKANQLARILQAQGIKNETIVGLMVGRSLEMIIGIFGILKAGGAYLPIDQYYPEERIQFMLKDSQTPLVVTCKNIRPEIPSTDTQYIYIDEDLFSQEIPSNLPNINTPKDLAYVIYTSGSTGKPKGVLLEHFGLANLQVFFHQHLQITKRDRILQFAPISFDASVWEIFQSLLHGATLYIPSSETIGNYNRLTTYLNEHAITIATLPPTYAKYLTPEAMQSLRMIITAGSMTTPDLVQNWQEKIAYINAYGPTETTICATYWKAPQEKGNYTSVPIGKPINNTKIYILDQTDALVPVGVIGELCIAGENLARGYLNRPQLTAEKFPQIDTHWSRTAGIRRLYRTGDLARWQPDGNIEFIGRSDHQVKIRGHRIELGEIESRLLTHPAIQETVVIAKEDTLGEKYLCSYFVCAEEVAVSTIRDYLSQALPGYMIPSYFMQLKKMPLTPSGKIDRKALPEPDKAMPNREYVAPTDKIEENLVELWQRILDLERPISIHENFFELGGHSLKAIRVAAHINETFQVELPLSMFFERPTVKHLGEYLRAKTMEAASSTAFPPIEPLVKRGYYPVSAAQRRLFALNQFDKGGISYNIPMVVRIEGMLDRARFEEAFQKLVERHESLRTSFELIDGVPVQKIAEQCELPIEYEDIEDQQTTIARIIHAFIRPFDLSIAPLFRMKILTLRRQSDSQKCENPNHLLLLDLHHIIADGISMNILLQELWKLYDEYKFAPLAVQYKDFAVWQNELFQTESLRKQQLYWIEKFSGKLPVLDLPIDFQRPSLQSFAGKTLYFEIDKKITRGLYELASRQGATLYMALLAAFNVLLSKYTGQTDIIVGSPTAGRRYVDVQQVVGMFVNTLAMRNYPEAGKTFRAFLQEVKTNTLQAFEHQDYQFDDLVDHLHISRDLSRNPVFDVMFALQNMEEAEYTSHNLHCVPYNFDYPVSKFDMTLFCYERHEGIVAGIEYCVKLFAEKTIQQLITHFLNILQEIIKSPEMRIADINMLTPEEQHQILFGFNNTQANYPKEKTIHQLFEEQTERTPENIAIVFENTKLTYRELNQKANQLAWVLREKGVTPDTIVGIMVKRSVEMIIGIFGILKAGGAYLPIDPAYPEERVKFILEDSETEILLTQTEFLNKIPFKGEAITLDDHTPYTKRERVPLNGTSHPHNLAYIIYTSGTTGNPKGVMIEHRNVVRLLFNEKFQFNFSQSDVWTMFHSFCFDFSVWEMYGALLYGGKLIIIPGIVAKDPKRYLGVLRQEQVTVLNQTPSAFYNLIQEELSHPQRNLSLRYVIFGGEALQPIKLKEWQQRYPTTKLINMYGITETTVHVTFKELTSHEIDRNISNIGKPIPTLTTYVMDQNLKLVPKGCVGELCVGGAGVARGYLHRPELTRSKFVFNPYSQEERLYRSGDLVKLLYNGEMEYLGRIDHQVKIRGFRVESGEIESQLLQHPGVQEVIVLSKNDQAEDIYLVAYYTCSSPSLSVQRSSQEGVSASELREYLQTKLPGYMVPSYFVKLESFPLTPNGKIDRKALPEPDISKQSETEYQAATDEIEETLIGICQKIIDKDSSLQGKISVNDNFFEIGGHSLHALRLISVVYQAFQIELPLQEIFTTPTIKGISHYIREQLATSEMQPYAEDSVILLNTTKPLKLFCFPDIKGYGIIYKWFAGLVKEYAVYALNYIGDGEREEQIIQQYQELITTTQPEGPYRFLGYSAGGNLAYEVAKQLEIQGHTVSDVIVLDACRKQEGHVPSKQELDSFEKEFLKSIPETYPEFQFFQEQPELQGLKEQVLTRAKNYYSYWSKLSNSGTIRAKIHVISAQDKSPEEMAWDELSTHPCLKYKGFGTHFEMLQPGFVEKNAEVIRTILSL